jgi:hypothetical protein
MLSPVAGQRPSREDLRRRVLGWQAAEAAEREIRRAEGPLSPSESLAWAEALCALNPAAMSKPDPVREREVAEARAAWDKLRARLLWKPGSKRAP